MTTVSPEEVSIRREQQLRREQDQERRRLERLQIQRLQEQQQRQQQQDQMQRLQRGSMASRYGHVGETRAEGEGHMVYSR